MPADLLPPVDTQLSATPTQLVPALYAAHHIYITCNHRKSRAQASTHPDTELRSIAQLKDNAQNRVIRGKFVPPTVQAAHPDSEVLQPVEPILADVFPATFHLRLPPSREGYHTIDLELWAKPPAHRVYRMSTAEKRELKSPLDAYIQAWQIEPSKSHFGAGGLFARKKEALCGCPLITALSTTSPRKTSTYCRELMS